MRDVSVVLISWCPNDYRLKLLTQSLASLRAHTHVRYTLIVVDNGPDEQTQIIEDYSPDIHIINEINRGVGVSRNDGAAATDSTYLAFVDSDIGYFPGWLGKCIDALEAYPERELIASAVKNKPMRLSKYDKGTLGEYTLHERCAGMAMVMKRTVYEKLGRFHERKTNVGHCFCAAAKKRGVRFLHHPDWHGRHLGRKSAYHYKREVFDPATGLWTPKHLLQESKV